MKLRVIILLLFIATVSEAQNWKRSLGVVGYHVGTIALGAVADGLYDEGRKEWSHALHAAEVGALIGGGFIFKPQGGSEILSYIASYTFLRISFYDGFYNLTRDLPVNYVGSTSTYDNVMSQIPPHGRTFIKSWSFVLGVSIPITQMR